MPRLEGFDDHRPGQGLTGMLCLPASLACAGRYLGAPQLTSIVSPEALKRDLCAKGFDYSGGGGRGRRLDRLAAAWGLRVELAGLDDVAGLLQRGIPVLLQWWPEFAEPGLRDNHGSGGHWSVLVEWPTSGNGRVVVSDPYGDDANATPKERLLSDPHVLRERRGISARPPLVSVHRT